mgnify:CR=1 FL=1
MDQLPQSACLRVNHRMALTVLCFMALLTFSPEPSAVALAPIEIPNDVANNLQNIQPPTTIEAQATRTVSMSGNLSIVNVIQSFDIDDPINTTAFSTGFQLFDSLGFDHGVTMYFHKTAVNTWEYNIIGAASEFSTTRTTRNPANTLSADGNWRLVATGTIGFTNGGLLDTEGTTTYHNTGGTGLTFTNGAAPILAANLTFNFGTSITTDGGAGTDGMLQQGGPSVLLTQSQDGHSIGVLSGVSTDETTGKILGWFSNGQVRELGQLQPTLVDIPDMKNVDLRNRHRRKRHNGNPTTNSSIVQAQQSGTWTVGQLGTWHVKIDSNQDTPMAVMDMMTAKRSPWAKTTKFQIENGQTNISTLSFTTPQSQRLVIEHISLMSTYIGELGGRTDLNMSATIHVTLHDQPVIHHIGISDSFITKRHDNQLVKYVLSKPFRIYADPGSQLKFTVERNYFNQTQNGTMSLSGYLEPMP